MQLNQNNLRRLLNMSDAQLAQTIFALAQAAGVDAGTASAAVRDLSAVRKGLASAGSGDIAKAAALLGEERARALFTLLEQSHG